MRLNRFTDIGLRSLMYLATQARQEPITVGELAQQLNVSRSHMVKVVHRLGQLGWVQTQRGQGGGLWLAEAALTVGLGQVVRVLEDEDFPVDCAQPACPLDGGCVLQGALERAMLAFYAELDKLTLGTVNHRRTTTILLQLQRNYLREREAG